MQPLPCPDARRPAAARRGLRGDAGRRRRSRCRRCDRSRAACATRWRSPSCAGPDVLLQGENSIDYADEAARPRSSNVLRDGADFGWPYCVGARDAGARLREAASTAAQSDAPAMLWPAHAAPLQMLAVPAGAGNAFAGQLLVAWHGYRAGGHRIVGYRARRAGPAAGRAARSGSTAGTALSRRAPARRADRHRASTRPGDCWSSRTATGPC